MLHRLLTVSALVLVFTPNALAQQAAPTSKTAIDKPAPAPRPDPPDPINVKLEITLTEQTGPGAAGKRTVSMIVGSGQSGFVRSRGFVNLEGKGTHEVILNVDAEPRIIDAGKIRLNLTLEYMPKPESENAVSGEGRARLSERLGLIVEAGKPMTVSQASDPTSDRRITVDLLATILK